LRGFHKDAVLLALRISTDIFFCFSSINLAIPNPFWQKGKSILPFCFLLFCGYGRSPLPRMAADRHFPCDVPRQKGDVKADFKKEIFSLTITSRKSEKLRNLLGGWLRHFDEKG
jgi:hypothetical protein